MHVYIYIYIHRYNWVLVLQGFCGLFKFIGSGFENLQAALSEPEDPFKCLYSKARDVDRKADTQGSKQAEKAT